MIRARVVVAALLVVLASSAPLPPTTDFEPVELVAKPASAALAHAPSGRARRQLFGIRAPVRKATAAATIRLRSLPQTARSGRSPSGFLNCSTMRQVASITHAHHGTGGGDVTIVMRPGSTCRKPYFRIRLSGVALATASTGHTVPPPLPFPHTHTRARAHHTHAPVTSNAAAQLQSRKARHAPPPNDAVGRAHIYPDRGMCR